jgi:hypothetical protein
VVIGAAIAQTELEDRPRHPADPRSRMAKARALGLQTPNEAVETTHVMLAPWCAGPRRYAGTSFVCARGHRSGWQLT